MTLKVIFYLCGTASCFAGLVLYGHGVENDQSIMAGAILIVVGVILLLASYTE